MKVPHPIAIAKAAMLTLAEIKVTTEAFDRGEIGAVQSLDSIVVAVEAYQEAARAALAISRDAA